MDSPTWAARFGVTDADLADLKNQVPPDTSVLQWLLANGNIPSDEYARWAMETFGLPSVRDSFFDIPADPVFWQAVRDKYDWSPSFYPLAEWDGVLLIGCLEPPSFHFPLRTSHRFVIASAHALEQRFHQLEPSWVAKPLPQQAPAVVAWAAPIAAPIQPQELAPVEDFSAAPDEVAPVVSAVQVRQRPADEILADSLPPAPDVSLDEPEGVLFEMQPASSDNLFVVPDGMSPDDVGQRLPNIPDGIEITTGLIDMDALDFSAAGEPADGDTQPLSQTPSIQAQQPSKNPTPAYTPPSTVAPAVSQPKAYTPPPETAAPKPQTSAPKQQPVVSGESNSAVIQLGARAPAVPPGPPTQTSVPPVQPKLNTPVVSSSVSLVPLAACSTADQLASMAVLHVQTHFEHALYLTFRDYTLRPAKWSDLLLSVKGETPDAISLSEPSVFRIASRTSLPYHGHVVANATNMAFYNAFNRGILPKHTTVMPIMTGGALSGMLVGLSMGEVKYKESLIAMEKLASEFSTHMDRLLKAAKKAAA